MEGTYLAQLSWVIFCSIHVGVTTVELDEEDDDDEEDNEKVEEEEGDEVESDFDEVFGGYVEIAIAEVAVDFLLPRLWWL